MPPTAVYDYAHPLSDAINQVREFFYATPAEVRELLAKIDGSHLLEYTELPAAAEWRASGSRRSA